MVPTNLEVGYGMAKGKDAETVGRNATRQALKAIKEHPLSLVQVFASPQYDPEALLRGVHQVIGPDSPLIGASTIGEILNGVQQRAVVVALASPYLQVKVAVGRGVSQDWEGAVIEAVTAPDIAPYFTAPEIAIWSLLSEQGESAFALLFSQGAGRTGDSSSFQVLETLERLSQGRLPILRGDAAATRRPEGNFVMAGDEVYRDSILVAVFETSLTFGISRAHCFQPISRRTTVTLSRDLEVLEWDNQAKATGGEALRQALLRGSIKDPGLAMVFSSGFRGRALGSRLGKEISGMMDQAPHVPMVGFCNCAPEELADHGVNGHPDEEIAVLALGRDLTQTAQLAMENESLRAALGRRDMVNAILQGVFKAAPIGIGFFERRVITWVNEYFSRMTGYAADELVGKSSQLFYEDSHEYERVNLKYEELIRKHARGAIETRWRSKDGRLIEVQMSFDPVNPAEPGGELIVTAQDISQRKQAEDIFKSLIYMAPIGIFIVQDGKFTLVNPGFTKITGHDDHDLLDQDSLIYVPEGSREEVRSQVTQMLKGERTTPCEFQVMKKSGEITWVLETVTPIQYRGRRATLGFFVDISERVKLEVQLLQSQRLESVGRLTGGVAHDFNNMLTAIMGYSELVMMSSREDDSTSLHLEGIRKSADRAAALTRQLLAFSRKQMLQPKVTDLNTVITNLEAMLRRIIGEDINLVILLDQALKLVNADPGQLEQVIMNLVINARDAMPMGGEITVQTANVHLNENFTCHHPDLKPGPYIQVAVIDHGLGMDQETLTHIFEPFFTTKYPGKGTGLGLSTAYGIIKQSGGHIEVSSQPQGGTIFEIYLPQIEDTLEDSAEHCAFKGTPRGSETVLVVEDEELLLSLIQEALEMHGYHVLKAGNAMEALELVKGHDAPIDLLLTDVVMPHQNGRELADLLSPLHPEMKILFMSGYTEDAMVVRGLLKDALPFIQKPFPPVDLVGKVREVMESPRV